MTDENDRINALAAVIAGEADSEGEAGRQAVANVIANRARRNFSGYGADLVAQAYAGGGVPNVRPGTQFQGISPRPSEAARSMAERLLQGDLPDLTGGATFYARPEPWLSSAPWARRLNKSNAYKIGHHFFTDNMEGRPFRGPDGNTEVASSNSQATESSGQYLVEREKEAERERNSERQATVAAAQAPHRNPAVAARGHFAHLHEIHGHLSEHSQRIADIEARLERGLRKGKVTDVDATNHKVRMEIGASCDGSQSTKSPWLPYAQVAGGAGGLNIHSVPVIGEQMLLVNPDGSPDFTQGLIVRHGFYNANPSPSTDPAADVTVRGTTINIRSMFNIVHSIGGQLTGALKSTISGGVTRIIDSAGHHITATGALVDSTADTHKHTSQLGHTDTVLKGNITHTAGSEENPGSIINTALGTTENPGSIVSTADSITSSALTMAINATVINIS